MNPSRPKLDSNGLCSAKDAVVPAPAESVSRTFRLSWQIWVSLALATAAIAFAFRASIADMVHTWTTRPEYSHGPLIPLVAAFLVWQQRERIARLEFPGSWWSIALIGAGVLLHLVGQLATIYVLSLYGMLLAMLGVVLALTGATGLRALWAPLVMLALMIPLPHFLLNNLSAELQLLSSRIGVWVIRLFGVSVHLKGNVIDLGVYQLQVAEACDGLRYLFPLITLGFVMACFFRAPLWKRALVLFSSIPITVFMNSLRIGVIGVTVKHWGVRMAEGFLHEFQGWLVFMLSAALMLGLMALLNLVGPDRKPWHQAFRIDLPARPASRAAATARELPRPLAVGTMLLVAYAFVAALLPERVPTIPLRPSLADFPTRLGKWSGQHDSLEPIYLRSLRLSDYLLANYAHATTPPVNLYVAWYDSQLAGQSAHSPRSCMPGGGWQMESVERTNLVLASGADGSVRVNRAVISHGNDRQVVYYWFQQRGRIITDEYLVKWYLLVDALRQNRTDGALVRLVTPVLEGESIQQADARLVEFAREAVPRLQAYIPGKTLTLGARPSSTTLPVL